MAIQITYADKADLEAQVRAAMDEYKAASQAQSAAMFRQENARLLLNELIEMLKIENRSVLDEALSFQRRMEECHVR